MSPEELDLDAIERGAERGDLDCDDIVPRLLAAARERDQLRADLAAARLDATNARAVAVEACDLAVGAMDNAPGFSGDPGDDSAMWAGYRAVEDLRARLAHPDAAKVREAVERLINSARAAGSTPEERRDNCREHAAAKAAVLALWGVK